MVSAVFVFQIDTLSPVFWVEPTKRYIFICDVTCKMMHTRGAYNVILDQLFSRVYDSLNGLYCTGNDIKRACTVLVLSTAPQSQRNVLKYFAIFKNVAHSLEPGETPSLTRLQTMYNVLKFSEKWWNNVKNQFTGTATQPQCNRKFCQFNNDQYWTIVDAHERQIS